MAANQGSEQTEAESPQEITRDSERKSLAGSKRRRKADSTDFIASGLTRRFGSALWSLPCLRTLKHASLAAGWPCGLLDLWKSIST